MNGLLALLAASLPSGEARYRFELGGESIGTAELGVRCAAGACAARWTVSTRAPAEAGGAIHARRVEVQVDAEGRWMGGALAVAVDGVPVRAQGVAGLVPVSLAELVLARAREDSSPCVDVFDEPSGRVGLACGRRGSGATWELEVLGVHERVRMGADGLPAEVIVPAQRARFLQDGAARVPGQPPRLWGVAVPWGDLAARARRFCGTAVDPAPPAPGRAPLPPPAAAGGNCREQAAAWLAAAARVGLEGRTAIGVAWDGSAFNWHAWAEVRVGGAWIPVDPAFGQLPARGPRFTLARYAAGDAAAEAAAGQRILDCWGRERIE